MSADNYFESSEEECVCMMCGMTYHKGGHLYFGLNVFGEDKLICADCYFNLRVVEE